MEMEMEMERGRKEGTEMEGSRPGRKWEKEKKGRGARKGENRLRS